MMTTEREEVSPAPFVTEQVTVVPVVPAVRVVELHGATIPDSGSEAVQVTVTSLMYQPFAPRVPAMEGAEIAGGV